MSTFQKNILKKYIGWLRGKKITKNQFFLWKKSKILNFWSFSVIFGPLNPTKFFLYIFFQNYLLSWRFWCQNFENRIKIQLMVIFKPFWNMNVFFEKNVQNTLVFLILPTNVQLNWKWTFESNFLDIWIT